MLFTAFIHPVGRAGHASGGGGTEASMQALLQESLSKYFRRQERGTRGKF